VRIAATADLHFGKSSTGTLQPLLSQIATDADALVVAGDITDSGTPDEARSFTRELSASVRIPVVAVLGNHDYEAGAEREIHQILVDHGLYVLDGDTCEIQGVGFAGV
jgi:3',5'-cyclic AMP phosphodiesterase CpdA